MSADDWSIELRLAEFDRLVTAVRRWVETAPPWPSLDRAKALWARVAPRLDQLRSDFDRVLVVGVVGGTGTGKSTLLNALVGRRICPAGDIQRPTTHRPAILAHPDIDISFLPLDGCQPEVHRLATPLLANLILIDCPDPDTQSRNPPLTTHDSPPTNQNLDLLRRVLPQCDVLLCTGTAQKYKTSAVAEELLRFAPGRQVVFVQTHAALDADITTDWRRLLESQGFSVPRSFRLDSEAALERTEHDQPLPPEFAQLVDFLHTELAGRASRRILRTNATDLLAWFLKEIQRDIDGALPALIELDAALTRERTRLFQCATRRLDEQLSGHQGLWRARLLGEVTRRWSWGPFAGLLRLLNSARSLVNFLPAIRARGLGPMLVTGGIGMGKAVADRVRQSWAERSWLAAAEMGIDSGDISQSQSVLTGFARQAGIDVTTDSTAGTSLEETAARWTQQLESALNQIVERRVAGRAGRLFHGILELLFAALPAVLLWRLATNFFYEHLWLGSTQPLLGLDFLAQSALWILVWGLFLRGFLAWRLQRGLKRDLTAVVNQLDSGAALSPLLAPFAVPAAAIRQHIDKLTPLAAGVEHLRHDLDMSGPSKLARLQSPTVPVGSS